MAALEDFFVTPQRLPQGEQGVQRVIMPIQSVKAATLGRQAQRPQICLGALPLFLSLAKVQGLGEPLTCRRVADKRELLGVTVKSL